MYIIGLNGPPRSGKDSIATSIWNQYNSGVTGTLIRHCSMPMRHAGFAMLGIPYSTEKYEEIKDQPQPLFNGYTFREWMILFSEQFMKPTFGHGFWGNAVLAPLNVQLPGLLLIPDIGFQAECDAFAKAVDEDNFLLIHLRRPGFDWGNDSRQYRDAKHVLGVVNELVSQASFEIRQYATNNMGWTL